MTISTTACPQCGHTNLPTASQCLRCHSALSHQEGYATPPSRGPLAWVVGGIGFVLIAGFLYSVQNQAPIRVPQFSAPVFSEAPLPPGEEFVSLPQVAESPGIPSANASVSGSWHLVTRFNGEAPQRTAPFTIRGRYWRINWTAASAGNVRNGSAARDWFYAFVYRNRGTVAGKLDGALNPHGGTVSLRNRGIYYINVNTNQRWALTIEEWW
jgi:hypothetical protein